MKTRFSDDIDQNIADIEDEDCSGPLLYDWKPEPDTHKENFSFKFVPGKFDLNNSECNGV